MTHVNAAILTRARRTENLSPMTLRVLFAASEVHPVVKTGGLADVASGLPAALAARGVEVRIALPAYRGWRDRVGPARRLCAPVAAGRAFTVWEAHPPGGPPLWLFDCPGLFDRAGSPYEDEQGRAFGDNGIRFGAFAHAVALAALDGAATGFAPDIVHANDWQTGLAMAWLHGQPRRPATVFTIHNLAYQGVFARDDARALGLPEAWWHVDGAEFHGGLSHLKAGIAYADAITTVSPTYAREIQQPAQGFGFDGLLRARAGRLHGIVNGIDAAWNPATDAHLAARYDGRSTGAGKAANRAALAHELGLDQAPGALLVGIVARFVHQKGTDLLLDAAPQLRALPLQFAILGRGEPGLQDALRAWAASQPGRVALRIAHDEALAHRIVAAADVFLMPSRYEPCGLTQLYSQRYGTVPVARRTGGLADTIVDATPAALADGSATGVLFEHADAGGIRYGLARALELRGDARAWRALQRAGMARDSSWRRPAADYLALYRRLALR